MLASLVLKDAMLVRWRVLVGAAFVVFVFVVSGQLSLMNGAWIHVATWMVMGQAAMVEEKSRAEVLLGTLPLSRRQIVVGRYLSVVTCAVALLVLSSTGMVAAAVALQRPLVAVRLAPFACVGLGMTLVFWAVAIPLLAHYGVTRAQMPLRFAMVLTMLAPGLLIQASTAFPATAGFVQWLARQPSWWLAGSGAVLGVLLALASYPLAAYLYERRDL